MLIWANILILAITAVAASTSAPSIEPLDPCTKPRALTCCASIEGDSDAYPTNPEGKLAFGCRHPRGLEGSELSCNVPELSLCCDPLFPVINVAANCRKLN